MIISLSPPAILSQDGKNPMLQLANENPLGIKIKETTKQEEIRITDDKPKAFKPTKSTTTTTTTPHSTTTITEISNEDAVAQSESSTTKKTVIEDTNQTNTNESNDYMDDGITFEENEQNDTSPPTKAFSDDEVEPELLLTNADTNTIGDETSNKSVRQTIENSTNGDIEQSSSENVSEVLLSSTTESGIEANTSEVFTSSTENDDENSFVMSSTPQNFVIIRQGGKTESFQIGGIEGLQRVEELENSQEDGSDLNPLIGELGLLSGINENIYLSSTTEENSSEMSSSTVSSENFDDNVTVAIPTDRKLDSTFQLNDSSIENLTNNSIEVSTSGDYSTERVYGTVFYGEESSTASPSSEEVFDTIFYGSSVDSIDSSSTTLEPDFSSSTTEVSTTKATESTIVKSSSTEPCLETSSRFTFEDEESPMAENPEFPYIPDDLSIHCKEIEEEEKRRMPSHVNAEEFSSSAEGINEKPAINVLNEQSSTLGPFDGEMKQSHEMGVIEARAPGEPLLIPEWERTTTTKTITEENTTVGVKETTDTKAALVLADENAIKKTTNDTIVIEKTDSSSEEMYGKKEPTTQRSTTKGYTNNDESSESSTQSSEFNMSTSTVEGVSPKDDAESIKLSEDADGDDLSYSASYEAPSLQFIPDSFQEYMRAMSKMNGWPA